MSAVIVRTSDNQKFLSIRDLITNKQVLIVKYRHLKSHKIIKKSIADAILEILQDELNELTRMQS